MANSYARKGNATADSQSANKDIKTPRTSKNGVRTKLINNHAPTATTAPAPPKVRNAVSSVKIADIIITSYSNSRLYYNETTAREYARLIAGGTKFPPILLTRDAGGSLHLADGRYRLEAYKKLGRKYAAAVIKEGDSGDAYLLGLLANRGHGVPLTREEKRYNIARLLTDEKWKRWSDRSIAKRCGVDHKTVSARRAQLFTAEEREKLRKEGCTYERNGRVSQMAAGEINKNRRRNSPSGTENSDNPPEPPGNSECPSGISPGAIEAYEKWKQAMGSSDMFVIRSENQAGCHIVALGDSTDESCVKRLFRGERADLYGTDPPYNAAIQSNRSNPAPETEEHIANNKISGADFERLLENSFLLARKFLTANASFYIWAAFPALELKMKLIKKFLGVPREPLVWVKKRFVYHARYDYNWGHELCLYGWVKKAKKIWLSDGSQTTIFDGNKLEEHEFDAAPRSHPCPKPVLIIKQFIENSLKPGKIVYDSFLGSGNTLIAAEAAGRLCYGVELVPEYVALVLERATEQLGLEVSPVPNGMSIDVFLKRFQKKNFQKKNSNLNSGPRK